VDYGWVSNNSIYAELGMDYTKIVNNIINNGEPGLLWLDNMRSYSRICDAPDFRDRLATGGNPCLEQTLESFELCCLAETFPFHHNSLEEFLNTIKYAFMYAKIVTLGLTHWEETNSVMSRNRRIGMSMTGIIQFLNKFGLGELKRWSEEGYVFLKAYDKKLSAIFKIPESIKITSIKPSGTVSLLGGATPGLHFPHSRFYIRRVRLAASSQLAKELKDNGYHVEPDVMQPTSTVVVSFPIDIGAGVKTIKDTNMWEQLSLAAFMQKYWADNQVSCTVTFNKSEASLLKPALDYFQYQLKGISFLPNFEEQTPYPQMPYEEINEVKYQELVQKIKSNHFSAKTKQADLEKHDSNFCDSDTCNI
jgi:ribonucleoside-triphosphate reductase